MIIPLEFQQKTINDLVSEVKNHYDSHFKKSSILFVAPTGSGKTFICSKAIEQLREHYSNENLVFLWISISQGGLESQTAKKFDSYGIPHIKLYNSSTFKNIHNHDVICAGWSALKAKSKNEDEKVANYKKSTEKNISFETHLNNLRSKDNCKFILFIDEAHNTSGSDLSQEIIDMIDPKVTIDITATPKNGNYQSEIIIDKQIAKKSGIIKQAIIINPGFDNIEYISEKILLEKAKEKRDFIYNEFHKQNLNINPLVIIQLKNENSDEVEELLKLIGINESEIAVWLSDKKVNIENITDNTNPISYLICNQAIATGWDCPRAHILVQMLKASEDFSEQIVGRILRTVDRVIYNNDLLDNAVVYTITNKATIEKIEEKIKTIHDVQYDMNLNEKLNVDIATINKEFTVHKESFEKIDDNEALSRYKFEIKNQIKNQIAKKLEELTTSPEIEIELKTVTIDSQEVASLELSEQDGSTKKVDFSMMEKYVVEKYGINASLYRLTEDLALHFNLKMSEALIDIAKKQLKYVLNDNKHIESLIYALPVNYKVATSLPGIAFEKSLYVDNDKYYTNKALSEPEKIMMTKLDESKNVQWWFKNFDSGKNAFSLVFNEDGEDKLHFPDFIIQTNNGLIFIETKIKSNEELEYITNNKKYETFSIREDMQYKMIFVDTKNQILYEKTGVHKDDINIYNI